MVIVSSGAIGVGCLRLGLKERPSAIAQKQALAAVGQVHLMRYYEDFFSAVGLVRTYPIGAVASGHAQFTSQMSENFPCTWHSIQA